MSSTWVKINPCVRIIGCSSPLRSEYTCTIKLPKGFEGLIDIDELNDILKEIEETFNTEYKALWCEHKKRKQEEIGFLLVFMFDLAFLSKTYKAKFVEFEKQMEDFVFGLNEIKKLHKRGLQISANWFTRPFGARGNNNNKIRAMQLILEKIE